MGARLDHAARVARVLTRPLSPASSRQGGANTPEKLRHVEASSRYQQVVSKNGRKPQENAQPNVTELRLIGRGKRKAAWAIKGV